MIQGKALYKLRKDCTEIQLCCHKNVNRILELMGKHHEHAAHLEKYAKLCLVLEKLCDYVSNCCCNQDMVSMHCFNELKSKCCGIAKVCSKLSEGLDHETAEYIRCKQMCHLCGPFTPKKSMSKRNKHSKGRGKTRKKRVFVVMH